MWIVVRAWRAGVADVFEAEDSTMLRSAQDLLEEIARPAGLSENYTPHGDASGVALLEEDELLGPADARSPLAFQSPLSPLMDAKKGDDEDEEEAPAEGGGNLDDEDDEDEGLDAEDDEEDDEEDEFEDEEDEVFGEDEEDEDFDADVDDDEDEEDDDF